MEYRFLTYDMTDVIIQGHHLRNYCFPMNTNYVLKHCMMTVDCHFLLWNDDSWKYNWLKNETLLIMS